MLARERGESAMEKSGYIYVLTNESFHRDNWIKIGYAEDVDKRAHTQIGRAHV